MGLAGAAGAAAAALAFIAFVNLTSYVPGARHSCTLNCLLASMTGPIFIFVTPLRLIVHCVSLPYLSTFVWTRTRWPRLPSGVVQVPCGTFMTDRTFLHHCSPCGCVPTPSILDATGATLMG